VPPPVTWDRGRPWRHGALRGRAYGAVPAALAERAAAWLAGDVQGLEPLRPPCVFRSGPLVVKRFPHASLFDRVRAPRAVRAAELHFRCLPIPSPRPFLAASAGRGRPGLLLREFVDGKLLQTAWQADARAADALVPFLLRMHAHDILHGDLHPGNLIWTDGGWMLLDVEGVRHGLHSRARVVEGQWARLLAHLADEPGVRRAYDAYRRLAGAGSGRAAPADAEWTRIRAEAERMAREFR
jgi:hypothetical protein